MTDQEYSAYLGVYQAYAWQQGYANHAVEFRLPDEHFSTGRTYDTEGFDLRKFFEVVADMDDGGIHYWWYYEKNHDRFLVLACTEDDSMTYMGSHADDFLTAAALLDKLKED
jgi:hypothetical protein